MLRQRGLTQVLGLLKLTPHYVGYELCTELTLCSSKVLCSAHACSELHIVWILTAASRTWDTAASVEAPVPTKVTKHLRHHSSNKMVLLCDIMLWQHRYNDIKKRSTFFLYCYACVIMFPLGCSHKWFPSDIEITMRSFFGACVILPLYRHVRYCDHLISLTIFSTNRSLKQQPNTTFSHLCVDFQSFSAYQKNQRPNVQLFDILQLAFLIFLASQRTNNHMYNFLTSSCWSHVVLTSVFVGFPHFSHN